MKKFRLVRSFFALFVRVNRTEVELEVNALAPQDRQILFGQLYENGFLVKTADDKAPEVAIGWRERKLNGKYDFKWLYAGKFAEGISEEASTKEGKLSPTTKSIKGSFYERNLDNAYEISVDESNLICKAYGDQFTVEELKNPETGLDAAGLILEFQFIDAGIGEELTKRMEKIEKNFQNGK